MKYKVKTAEKDVYSEWFKAHTIFAPQGKDIRATYPELLEHKEFNYAKLNKKEMDFVWFYKVGLCENKDNDRLKLHNALLLSGLLYDIGDDKKEEYTVFEGLPNNIKEACKKMELFNPTFRMLGAIALDIMFKNLLKIQSIDVDDICWKYTTYKDSNGELKILQDKNGNDVREVVISEVKKYTDMAITMIPQFKTLVTEREQSFGVSEMSFVKEGTTIKPIALLKQKQMPAKNE